MKLEKANGRIHTQRTNKMFLLAVATAKQKAAKMTQQKKKKKRTKEPQQRNTTKVTTKWPSWKNAQHTHTQTHVLQMYMKFNLYKNKQNGGAV